MNPEKDVKYVIFDFRPKTSLDKTLISQDSTIGEEEDDEFEYFDDCDFDFVGYEKQNQVKLGPYDSKCQNQVVVSGVNLKGTCTNNKCTAYNKPTWIRKGYGYFKFEQTRFHNRCPVCNHTIPGQSVKELGFVDAEIQIEGMLEENGKQAKIKKNFSKKMGRFIFFEELSENFEQWGYVHINAKRP